MVTEDVACETDDVVGASTFVRFSRGAITDPVTSTLRKSPVDSQAFALRQAIQSNSRHRTGRALSGLPHQMGVLGIGIDLLHVPRFQAILTRRGSTRMIQRILTPKERDEYHLLLDDAHRLRYLGVR